MLLQRKPRDATENFDTYRNLQPHRAVLPAIARLSCWRYCSFLCSWVTPPLFHPNFWGVSVAPDRPYWGQPEQKPYAIRPWNYFRNIPTYVITVPERYRPTERFGRWRSSKVIDFGTNRKHICDFLLVCHSNLGPPLHRFGDIAGFCAPEWPHSHSTLILGVFPLHQIAHVGVSPRIKLFGREIIFEEFQPIVITLPKRYGRSDRQTTHCGITALCVASRGKNPTTAHAVKSSILYHPPF